MFGNKPAFGGSSVFGASSSVFGTPQAGTSLFGAGRPTVSFGQQQGGQSTGGGLFGSTATTTASGLFSGTAAGTGSLFGTAAAPAATFGTGSGTGGGLFGTSTASAAGSTFQTGSSMFSFSGNQPTVPAATGAGGLFGYTSLTSAAGGTGTTGGLFGLSAASAQQSAGTAVKFNPLVGQDQMVKNSLQTTVNTRHQCITAMKEYEGKSLEELRCEDYLLNRKGPQQVPSLGAFNVQPQQQQPPQTSLGLFGSSGTGVSSLFGNRTAFGTPATTAATGSGLFGTSQTGASLFSQQKSLYPTTTTAPATGFTFGTPATTSVGLFGATQPQQQQQAGLFGTSAVTTAQPTNLFGSSNAAAQPSLFGTNQPSTGAFTFGKTTQATGLFGQPQTQSAFGPTSTSMAPTAGFSFGSTPTPSFGASAAGTSLFGAKTTASALPAFGGFGTQAAPPTFGTQTSGTFGFGTPQPSSNLFGSTGTQQIRPLFGGGISTNLFSQQTAPFGQQAATGVAPNQSAFGSSLTLPAAPLMVPTLGSDQATLAAQQTLIQSQLLSLAQSPYGDSKLLKLLKNKRDSPPSSTQVSSSNVIHHRQQQNMIISSVLSPQSPICTKVLPPARPPSRVLTMSLNLKGAQTKDILLKDAQNNKLTFNEGYMPKRNVKKLILNKPNETNTLKLQSRSSATLSSSDYNDTMEKSNQSATYQQLAGSHEEKRVKSESESGVAFGSVVTSSPSLVGAGVDFDTTTNNLTPVVTPLTRRALARLQSTDTLEDDSATRETYSDSLISTTENTTGVVENMSLTKTEVSLNDRREPKKSVAAPHPAGIICTRSDYYTIPALDELAAVVGEGGGECTADGFTIGRYDYGSVFWPERVDVTGLNIDLIVHFRHKEVTVYPDDVIPKPPVGQGLNRRAEITLERVWPNDKTTHSPVKDPKRLEVIRFRERLERACSKMGAEFCDYRPDTGSWVFKVSHFSKYGLTDDADEEDDVALAEKVESSKEYLLQHKIQREKIDAEHLNRSSAKYPDEAYAYLSNETAHVGLGGLTHEDTEQAFDVEFSETEPSFLVKSDLSSLFQTNDEHIGKIKEQLFYESKFSVRAIKPEPMLIEEGEFTVTSDDIFKDDKSRRLFLESDFDHTIASIPGSKSAKMPPVKDIAPYKTLSQVVQPENVIKIVPYDESLFKDLRSFYDCSAFNGRRFRIGWASHNRFLSCGLTTEHSNITSPSVINKQSAPIRENDRLIVGINLPYTEDLSTNLVEIFLLNQLVYSARLNRHGCPHFVPTNGVELAHCYITALDECDFTCYEKPLVRRVFALCCALWGHVTEPAPTTYVEDIRRKENLSEWLSMCSKNKVEQELEQFKAKGRNDILKIVFGLVNIGKIEEAAVTAFNNGDVRLALTLSLIGGSETEKALFRQQLSQWFQCQADRYMDEDRLKLYVLLAGYVNWKTSDGSTVKVCDKLDWKRCFALVLRFCLPYASSIAEAVKVFDDVWTTEYISNIDLKPYPEYCEASDSVINKKQAKKDICYHLIKLYSEQTYRLESVLSNETWTTDLLSYYLTWHLWCVLSALGFSMTDQRKNQMHAGYAAQLERCGLWHWSLFVLMHIADDVDREKAVKRVLSLYATEATEEQLRFLKNELSIPAKWIFEAKALKTHVDGDKVCELKFLLKINSWNLAHRLFVEHVGPTKIVDGNFDDLQLFLDELSSHDDEIENWTVGGQIFMNYVALKSAFYHLKQQEDIQPENLNTLKPTVLSLATKIKYVYSSTPLQRLCQSEMAFFIAQMLQLVFGNDGYLEMTEIITSLPMPDDFMLEELQRITDNLIDKTNWTFV